MAVKKTSTASALRELIIWIVEGEIKRDNKITMINAADWLGAVEGAAIKPGKSD